MKSVNLIILAVLTLFLSFIFAFDVSAKEQPIGKITFLLGGPQDVLLKHKNQENWQPAKMNMAIYQADMLQSKEESRCEVKLRDGGVIRIGENTYFEFTNSIIKEKKLNTRTVLKRGKIWANLSKRKGKSDFQIKAPTAVCAVRGTIFRVDGDTSTTCLVYDGTVDVGPVSLWGKPLPPGKGKSLEPEEVPGPHEVPPPYEVSLEEWVKIVKGFQIIVRPDGKYAKSKIDQASDAKLEWVQWNRDMDARLK